MSWILNHVFFCHCTTEFVQLEIIFVLQSNSSTPPMKSPTKMPHYYPGMLPPPPPPPPNLARPVAIMRTSDGQAVVTSGQSLMSPAPPSEYNIIIMEKKIMIIMNTLIMQQRGHRGRDRMVVGFMTTYAISAYHH